MLERIVIENIATIKNATIDLRGGFSVLTGETGAGKSIIIDSINLILGQRASRDIIRGGCDKAYVCAYFTIDNENAAGALVGADVFPDSSGYLMVERELYASGKTFCKINSRAASVAKLKEIGGLFVNIHGQHDNQDLLQPDKHIGYLDAFGELENDLAQYREIYAEFVRLKKEFAACESQKEQRAERIDLLSFQIGELEAAALSDGEEEALCAQRKTLQNSEKIKLALEQACLLLAGDDERSGAVSVLSAAGELLRPILEFCRPAEEVSGRLSDALILTEDCSSALRSLLDSADFDKDALQAIEDRLAMITDFKKKYGSTVADMLEYLDRSKKELAGLVEAGENRDALAEALSRQAELLKKTGEKLSAKRRSAAERLDREIIEQLTQLEMKDCRFKTVFDSEYKKFGSGGRDRVEFMIAANRGEELKPLAKVASGGELSRVMLAIKAVILNGDLASTLIFDEIDSGVSGAVASKIGKKLKQLAKAKQVVCVTHLSQIATMADNHLLITKKQSETETETSVRLLDRKGRELEIARIISGEHITDLSLQNARELLNIE